MDGWCWCTLQFTRLQVYSYSTSLQGVMLSVTSYIAGIVKFRRVCEDRWMVGAGARYSLQDYKFTVTVQVYKVSS